MPDVKKLITGFLILAAGASSSALILSNIGSSGNVSSAAATGNTAPTSSISLGDTGFTDQPSQDNIAITPASSTDAALGDPDNVTDDLADAFVSGIVASNPDGPVSGTAGDTNLNDPDQQTIADALQNEPGLTSMTVPDWDTEVSQLQNEIQTVPDSTSSITDYINGFTAINATQLVNSGLQDVATQDSEDTSILPKAGAAISNMLSEAIALQTPASLLDFQKSFIKVLVYENNTYLLAANPSLDPAKTILTLQYEQDNYNQAIQDFTDEAQTLVNNYTVGANTPAPRSSVVAFVNTIFAIPTANAQWAVTDPLTHLFQQLGVSQTVAAQWGTYLAKIAQDVALQIVKNVLVALIQQKVLTWIQGSGAPRFIQQWGTTIVNAYTQTALNALNSQMACVNPLFAGPLRLTLGAYYLSNQNSCAAQFQSFLGSGSNLQSFYNKFSNGGFVTFGQTLLPSNDYYGQLFFTAQNITLAGTNAQTAAQSKAIAGQGFTGSQVCADGSNPNGTSYMCVDSNGDQYYPNKDGSCPDPTDQVYQSVSNDGLCANGQEPSVTMPSVVTGQALNQALGASPKLITSANSVAGIINALASSLIAGIAQAAIQGATKSITGALINSPGNESGLLNSALNQSLNAAVSSTPSLTTGLGVQCSPSQTQEALDPSTNAARVYLNASGGTIDTQCASNNTLCTPGENTDGTPTYAWSAPGATNVSGGTNAATPFVATYNAPGTYIVGVVASTDNSSSTCTIVVSANTATTTPPTGFGNGTNTTGNPTNSTPPTGATTSSIFTEPNGAQVQTFVTASGTETCVSFEGSISCTP